MDRGVWGVTVHGVLVGQDSVILALTGSSEVKASAWNAGDPFDPWIGKIPWRRKWQPTPVLLPGESHGQRSLAGYGPQDRKELDMTEAIQHAWTSLVAQMVKNPPAMWETWVRSLGWEDLMEK